MAVIAQRSLQLVSSVPVHLQEPTAPANILT
jgi:hypothetical protein